MGQTGKTAIITGASKGIGKATAVLLATKNINVVINYLHDDEGANATAQVIEQAGGTALVVQGDVSQPAAITDLFDKALARFGQVDILVNNAGAILYKEIKDITEEDFDRIFAVNVKSVFFAMKEAATRLANNGRIINVSSTTTRTIFPTYGLYSASKAAVEQASRVFAKEMGARGITVNSVLPGPTKTKLLMTGKSAEDIKRLSALSAFNRMGEPEDIARVIAFLASDDADWVSAQAIGANGGFV